MNDDEEARGLVQFLGLVVGVTISGLIVAAASAFIIGSIIAGIWRAL